MQTYDFLRFGGGKLDQQRIERDRCELHLWQRCNLQEAKWKIITFLWGISFNEGERFRLNTAMLQHFFAPTIWLSNCLPLSHERHLAQGFRMRRLLQLLHLVFLVTASAT